MTETDKEYSVTMKLGDNGPTLEDLVELLNRYLEYFGGEDTQCYIDHYGYCQEHMGDLVLVDGCTIEETKTAIAYLMAAFNE